MTVNLSRRTQKVLSQIIRKDETYEQLVNYIIQGIDVKDWVKFDKQHEHRTKE